MRQGTVLAWTEGTDPRGVSASLWEAGVGVALYLPLPPGHSTDLQAPGYVVNSSACPTRLT